MTITITYKNGNTLTQSIHYCVVDEVKKAIVFANKTNPTDAVIIPVSIPFENIATFTIDPNDDRANVYSLTAAKKEETLFFLDDLTDADEIFGDQQPTCLDEAEVRRLSAEWERDLFEIMHEASDDEIAQWGTYTSSGI